METFNRRLSLNQETNHCGKDCYLHSDIRGFLALTDNPDRARHAGWLDKHQMCASRVAVGGGISRQIAGMKMGNAVPYHWEALEVKSLSISDLIDSVLPDGCGYAP